jgi:hypothetical protein
MDEWHVTKLDFVNQAGTFIHKGPYLTVLHIPSNSLRNYRRNICTRRDTRPCQLFLIRLFIH